MFLSVTHDNQSPPHVLIQLVQQVSKEWAISYNNGCWFTLSVHHHGTHMYHVGYHVITHTHTHS